MKRILVIGATSAIAIACARKWAELPARFFLVGRDAVRLGQIADDLRIRGAAEVTCHALDLNCMEEHAAMLEAASVLQGFDIALVAHGTLPDQSRCQADAGQAVREFTTNATSVIAVTTAIAERMRVARAGTIAIISSVAGDRGRRSNYLYGAAKAAVSTFCEGLAARLQAHGVHVLTIKPGFVSTPMTANLELPALLTATPERVASDIVKAVERRAFTLYTPWFWRYIMLIIRLMPGFVLRRLSL
jgi:short-subunit dehydrogenase